MLRLFVFVSIFLFPFYASVFGQIDPLYVAKGCSSCHGTQAEGNRVLKAPALSGQSEAYLKRQLKNFQNRVRGEHPEDYLGKSMWGMASVLTESEIDSVSASLAKMKPAEIVPTVAGYAAKGKPFYAACGVCHGENAQGNDALNAPNLTVLQDWYLVAQLKKFKGGLRGGDPVLNPVAAQMMPMAMTLPTEEEMEDLALYILNLKLP